MSNLPWFKNIQADAMVHPPLPRSVRTLFVASIVVLVAAQGALAHEQRKVGEFTLLVGWADEPVYVGIKNGIELQVKDAAGRPVRDLQELSAQVIFGPERSGLLSLTASEDEGATPGTYQTSIIPTRPGRFTFRISGSIKGHKIDESFASSESALNPSGIEFPAKGPTGAELAGLLGRLQSRAEALRATVDATRRLAMLTGAVAVVGILVGAAGLIVGLDLRRRRRGSS